MAKPDNEFYENERLSAWLVNLLIIGLLITVAGLVSTVFELRLLDDMARGNYASETEMSAAADTNDSRQLAIARLELLWFVVTGVLALIWIHRSAHNARVHSRAVEYSPGSAVWWFFIPIATLWKPYGAMKETFAETESQARESATSNGSLLGAWWATWIIMGLAYNVNMRLSLAAHSIDKYRVADNVAVFASVMDLVCTTLFIVMIRRLTAMQEHVRANPPPPQAELPGGNW